jgi:hypothetical protein
LAPPIFEHVGIAANFRSKEHENSRRVESDICVAKLRLVQAEELVAASGVADTKADTGKALSYIESALRKVENR